MQRVAADDIRGTRFVLAFLGIAAVEEDVACERAAQDGDRVVGSGALVGGGETAVDGDGVTGVFASMDVDGVVGGGVGVNASAEDTDLTTGERAIVDVDGVDGGSAR